MNTALNGGDNFALDEFAYLDAFDFREVNEVGVNVRVQLDANIFAF